MKNADHWSRYALALLLGTVLFSAGVNAAEGDAEASEKIKHFILIDLDENFDLLWLDRWYLTYHAPERRQVVRNFQRHYLSYMTYDLPAKGGHFNSIHGRLTEIHFDSLADFQDSRKNNEVGDFHTPPPGGWKAVGKITPVTVPTNPTEVFIGGFPRALDHPYFRWMVFINYPEGVDAATGEQWYLETHAKEAMKLPGLRRFVSYSTRGANPKFARVSELWFDTKADWEAAMADHSITFTAPEWGGNYPFVDIVSAFVGERPDIDFIDDHRSVP